MQCSAVQCIPSLQTISRRQRLNALVATCMRALPVLQLAARLAGIDMLCCASIPAYEHAGSWSLATPVRVCFAPLRAGVHCMPGQPPARPCAPGRDARDTTAGQGLYGGSQRSWHTPSLLPAMPPSPPGSSRTWAREAPRSLSLPAPKTQGVQPLPVAHHTAVAPP